MGNDVSKWDNIMGAALSMPLVNVTWEEFLRGELAP